MFKVYILFFFVLYSVVGNSQIAFSAKKVPASQIPSSLKFKGKLQEAWKWKDNLGENVLILSATDIVWNANEDEATIQLFAYQFCKKDSGYRTIWKLNDMVQQCPVDIKVEFINGAAVITDLDKDGVAETTLQYKLACRGDVSPADMKLIMHEDSVKYALRGTMWSPFATENPEAKTLPITEKDVNLETLAGYKGTDDEYFKTYGRYKSEKEFLKAPPSFIQFARKQWLKYAKESFE